MFRWVTLLFVVLLGIADAGVPTVGLASSSADIKVLPGEGPQDALRRALNQYGTAHFLPGTYQFTAPLVGTFNNVRITGTRGAILKPTTSGATGLFDLTGNGIIMDGFKVLTNTYVADQTVINFSGGKDITIQDVVFEATINAEADSSTDGVVTAVAAPTGSTSTPMILLDFDTVLRKTVDRCVFLPDYAVTCIRSTHGAGIKILNSHFANNIDAGLGGISLNAGPTILYAENPAPRLCWRGIEITGDEWGTISGCRFFGLGDSNHLSTPYYTGAPYEMDFVIQIKKGTEIPDGGLLTTESEAGHITITNNRTEWCAAPKAIKILGTLTAFIEGNIIGFNPSANALGEGNIIIGDTNEGGSGTDISSAIDIYNNNIHNPGASGTEAAAIFAYSVSDLTIKGNAIGALFTTNAIVLGDGSGAGDSSTLDAITISGNTFRGNSANTRSPIRITAGTGITNGIFVGNNDYEGFAGTVSADDPAVNVVTSSGTGTAGVDDFMGTVGATPTTITRTAGSFVTEGWVPGDVFTAAGLDTAADNSKPLIIRSVAALTLTLEGYPLTLDNDNGTDVVLTEIKSACVVNESSSTADYFLEGIATKNGAPAKLVTSTGLLTNITIASNVVTRAAGSFLTDGFEQGDQVVLLGALATSADIGKVGYISALTATAMTLTGLSLTDDGSAAEDVVIMKINSSASTNASLD